MPVPIRESLMSTLCYAHPTLKSVPFRPSGGAASLPCAEASMAYLESLVLPDFTNNLPSHVYYYQRFSIGLLNRSSQLRVFVLLV